MFKGTLKVVGMVIGALLLMLAGVGMETFVSKSPDHVLGSVNQANEYHSTTTPVGATAGTFTVVSSSQAVLGSVVITSSSASTFTLLDADGSGTSTIAVFKESAAAGTYTFDVALTRGLRITVPSGFTGNFVTTYR